MSWGADQPTTGDYAMAAASDAKRVAQQALELETSNKEAIDYIRQRQVILEEHLGLTDVIGAEMERRAAEARRIAIPPHMVGEVVIPEGYQGQVEGDHIVFRPVD